MNRWYKEKKREHYYKKAKKFGYRSRSSFKLMQIQRKYNIIKLRDIVIDLGAAPGGWSQIAKEFCGENGLVIGIDLSYIKPIKNIIFFKGDITEEKTINKIINYLNNKKADIILSDLSPNISGNYNLDQARSVYLCNKALNICEKILKYNGNFVCKVFEGSDLKEFVNDLNSNFKFVNIFNPPASRKSSSELYIISKNYKKYNLL
jgi:23S rRNA (uridine2552-2'-O)-methyltransferase